MVLGYMSSVKFEESLKLHTTLWVVSLISGNRLPVHIAASVWDLPIHL